MTSARWRGPCLHFDVVSMTTTTAHTTTLSLALQRVVSYNDVITAPWRLSTWWQEDDHVDGITTSSVQWHNNDIVVVGTTAWWRPDIDGTVGTMLRLAVNCIIAAVMWFHLWTNYRHSTFFSFCILLSAFHILQFHILLIAGLSCLVNKYVSFFACLSLAIVCRHDIIHITGST